MPGAEGKRLKYQLILNLSELGDTAEDIERRTERQERERKGRDRSKRERLEREKRKA